MSRYINLRNKLVNQLMEIPYNTKVVSEINKMKKLVARIEYANKKIISFL